MKLGGAERKIGDAERKHGKTNGPAQLYIKLKTHLFIYL